jgi:hypothetical protein
LRAEFPFQFGGGGFSVFHSVMENGGHENVGVGHAAFVSASIMDVPDSLSFDCRIFFRYRVYYFWSAICRHNVWNFQ